MSWKQVLPKIAIILPLTLLINLNVFQGFYITLVAIFYFLIRIIAPKAKLIINTGPALVMVVAIFTLLFIEPFFSFILAIALHAMLIASILGKL